MPKINSTDWKTQVKIFEKYGCTFVRQKGSHMIFDHSRAKRPVVIPKYDEVPVTVILANMRTVGMTREEYFILLEEVR